MTSVSTHEPALRAQSVIKELRGGDEPVLAVRGTSLTIPRGQFVAITGPSGSGKSTLLYLLGALDRPTSGRVYIDGQDTSSLADPALAALRREKIGFVFQFHFLLPELTALDNVALPMMLSGVAQPAARAQAEVLLDRLELSHRKAHLPHELSGGQQQRVALARALANSPLVLLGDEPTGNLDTANSLRVYEWLREHNLQQGQTIVLVTHNPELASAADRIIELVDGAVVNDSAPEPTEATV
ncbi:MAG: ABC transporter ATP-binding protein [Candidatus Sericytochromatia bacterium]|nr:ABC transporter ATP-binding protein [Candidatus Sericytochromatia bacterium]